MEAYDLIFREEQDHLSALYKRLREMEKSLEEKLDQVRENALEEKKAIREDLTLNFDSDTNAMETYAEFEVMNHVIDNYNIISRVNREKLDQVRVLLKAPYFAKVRLQYDPEEEPEEYYIGTRGLTGDRHEQLVVDWRSPVAETYYNQSNGPTSYTVDGRTIPVDLLLRRQFDLKEDVLRAWFDTTIAIEDPLLLESLSKRRSDKMTAITTTIQKEQNEVIRHKDVPVLLVSGIAGSGKTSVLLQRIAYLFYQKRNTLRPDQVYLMTLNPVFRQYIENVLPDMGETNPHALTWLDFLDMAGFGKRGAGFETRAEDLDRIDASLKDLVLTEEDFTGIRQGGEILISPRSILAVSQRYPHIGPGPRLTGLMEDDLLELLKSRLRRKDGYSRRDREDQGREDENASCRENNRMENDFAGAFAQVRGKGFLNLQEIGKKILGRTSLSPVELFYLKMALTGECDRNARYLMIDEVQDYTEAQIRVLSRYFLRAHFMLLGDENQAIRPGTASFARIRVILSEHGKAEECSLMTSYRSSPEITDLFTAFLEEKDRVRTTSVQRPGQEPVIRTIKGREAYLQALKEALKEARESEGLTCMIAGSRRRLEKLSALLGDDAPPVIRRDMSLPERGPVLMELPLVKGLEFDSVIIPDAVPEEYPEDSIGKHRLYTAISRATRRVSIFAEDTMTALLKGRES